VAIRAEKSPFLKAVSTDSSSFWFSTFVSDGDGVLVAIGVTDGNAFLGMAVSFFWRLSAAKEPCSASCWHLFLSLIVQVYTLLDFCQ
jgi:hypothetical protein